jgi:hypothetical protein
MTSTWLICLRPISLCPWWTWLFARLWTNPSTPSWKIAPSHTLRAPPRSSLVAPLSPGLENFFAIFLPDFVNFGKLIRRGGWQNRPYKGLRAAPKKCSCNSGWGRLLRPYFVAEFLCVSHILDWSILYLLPLPLHPAQKADRI